MFGIFILLISYAMNIILDKIYSELKRLKKVAGKGDFADKLKYNRTYVSELLNSDEQELPDKLQVSLKEIFGINPTFIETGEGQMFTTTRAGDTKSPQPGGKVAKWVHDMRGDLYKKLFNKEYPKSALQTEIDMYMEELEEMRKKLEEQDEMADDKEKTGNKQ